MVAQSAGSAVAVNAGYGAAVGTNGTVDLQPLLPAPVLGSPERLGSGRWTVSVSPVSGAVAYLVQVSRDAEGLELVSSEQFDDANISFSARHPGTHYVSVRAIDAAGLGGRNAYAEFEGANALLTTAGEPVRLGSGDVVILTDY